MKTKKYSSSVCITFVLFAIIATNIFSSCSHSIGTGNLSFQFRSSDLQRLISSNSTMPKSRGYEDNDLFTVEIAIKGDYQKTQSIKMDYIDTNDEYNADFQVPIGATVYVTIEVYFQNDNTEKSDGMG